MPGERQDSDTAVQKAEAPPVSAGSGEPATPLASGEEIAQVLMGEGVLTPEQLAHARRVRSKLPSPMTLLNVLRDLALVSDESLRRALRANQSSVRLGTLLVELGELREAELEAALAIQRQSPELKIGEILVREHFIDEQKVSQILSYQLGFPHIEPDPADMDNALVNASSLSWYTSHQFIPVARQGDKVTVAFVDPLDLVSRQAAESVFGTDLTPAIATRSAVMEILSLWGGKIREKPAAPAGEPSAVEVVDSLIEAALQDDASDIHLEPMKDRLRVRFRRNGAMMLHKDFPRSMAQALTSRIKILAGADVTERRRHQDGRIDYRHPLTGAPLDIRLSSYITIHGENLVLRLLNKKGQLLDLGDIGLAPKVLDRLRGDALDVPSGIIIVCGPTGSGKTTTLYSAVNYLNDPETCIITAEDPVEYAIEGITQCSINLAFGITFEETLRHIVRQDPDVIVLGEIRDRLSAEVSIQAALTGHKVLTTFHSEDTIGALMRLTNMGIEPFLLSCTVSAVVAERLLRRVCPDCAAAYVPRAKDLYRFGYGHQSLEGASFLHGRGCASCRYTGYNGRVGIFEVLLPDESVREAILSRKSTQEIRQIAMESAGMVTLLEEGLAKAAKGITSFEEVRQKLPRLTRPRPLQLVRRLLGEVT